MQINQYTQPTITEPPIMLPIVTGNRLARKQLPQVRIVGGGFTNGLPEAGRGSQLDQADSVSKKSVL